MHVPDVLLHFLSDLMARGEGGFIQVPQGRFREEWGSLCHWAVCVHVCMCVCVFVCVRACVCPMSMWWWCVCARGGGGVCMHGVCVCMWWWYVCVRDNSSSNLGYEVV